MLNSLPKLYLKSPFFRAIKNEQTKYLIRLERWLYNAKGRQLILADGRQNIKVSIRDVQEVLIDKIPWYVLDAYGYQSREALKNQFKMFYKTESIDKVYVLEVIVQ